MVNTRVPVFLAVLAALLTAHGNVQGQRAYRSSTSARQPVVALNFANNGQHMSARVGQQIEISLGTIGPRQYGAPEISSPALRLVSTAEDWPPNPGGPSFVYIFEAVAEGEAWVKIQVMNADQMFYTNDLTFTVMIRVGSAGGRPSALRTLLAAPDQANIAKWQNAWTNLNNSARQTFTPSLPRLTGVEVELVVANPGPDSADVSLMVSNEDGAGVAQVTKTVLVSDCGHVLFLLPRGGLPVSAGQVYSITLSGGDGLFGWKYVVGGYANGSAWFNSNPLLKDARSTFLFRTFGAN
jgi:hypothetical protein